MASVVAKKEEEKKRESHKQSLLKVFPRGPRAHAQIHTPRHTHTHTQVETHGCLALTRPDESTVTLCGTLNLAGPVPLSPCSQSIMKSVSGEHTWLGQHRERLSACVS